MSFRLAIRHAFLACAALLPLAGAQQQGPASMPPSPDAAVERIAFGSCLQQNQPAPIFDAINAFAPDTFIFLGDNVYGDTRDMDKLAADYEKLGAMPGFQQLKGRSRILAIWDDHDMGQNDAGAEFPLKAESKKIMLDFFGEPAGSARREREGNYDSVTLGPPGRRVQFILLDTRWFRSPLKSAEGVEPLTYIPSEDPEATVLSGAQWSWLQETLAEPADIRVICTSIQLLARQHRFEKWANFPAERKRMIELLRGSAGDILVLSGDRHSGEMSVDQWHGQRGPNVLVETTASSLNQRRSREGDRDEPNDYRAGPILYEPNFGTIEIDWAQRLVTVALRDQSGAPAKQIQLRMQEPQ